MTHNLLQLLKAVALPIEYAKTQPKPLRFGTITQFGRVIRHPGQTLLRLAGSMWQSLMEAAFRKIQATAHGQKQ